MVPTLFEGDRLLVLRTRRARAGDVVALADPRERSRTVVKRVLATHGSTVSVGGDNPGESTDSRHFGPVPRRLLRGRVVYRYAPAGRTGRVRRGPLRPEPTMKPMASSSQTLDRILGSGYLDDLERLPVDDVRARRAECQEVETGLSYARRLVQGHLDIIHAELERRGAGVRSDMGELVDALKEGGILGDQQRPAGFGRLPTVMAPGTDGDPFVAEIEAALRDEDLAALPDLSDAEVTALADRLGVLERSLSDRRREVFDRIDALQAEIVRRYRSGALSPDQLLG